MDIFLLIYIPDVHPLLLDPHFTIYTNPIVSSNYVLCTVRVVRQGSK